MYNPELMQRRLVDLRRQTGLSQAQASKKIGIAPSVLCHIETGRCVPSLNTLDYIADFYGVSIDWLCGRVKKIPPLLAQERERQ